MSGGGAKMRAIYKFPALERSLKVNALDRNTDRLCPLIKVTNSLDGTSKISIEIGAFSFVCTNFAVGGSGVFAGGFMAVHCGTIRIDSAGDQLRSFLSRFDRILDLFSYWSEIPAGSDDHKRALQNLPERYLRDCSPAVRQPVLYSCVQPSDRLLYSSTSVCSTCAATPVGNKSRLSGCEGMDSRWPDNRSGSGNRRIA
jgi:hypothetical protein